MLTVQQPEDINAAEEAEVVMKTQAGEHKFTVC